MAEKVTLNDDQLAAIRATIDRFCALRAELDIHVQAADVEIGEDKVVHLRVDRDSNEFVVDL